MMQFELVVEGLETDGHPEIKMFTHLDTAILAFRAYQDKYPHHNVKIYEINKTVLKSYTATLKKIDPPKCPWKHEGVGLDGRPVMREGSVPGVWHCMTCGYKIQLKVK